MYLHTTLYGLSLSLSLSLSLPLPLSLFLPLLPPPDPYPENPDPLQVHFQAEPDTRDGFWEHAIITVTWPPVTREWTLTCMRVCMCVCVWGTDVKGVT